MSARVRSCATVGIEGHFVEVEADLGVGLPTLTIVGLPDAAVRESRERVRPPFGTAATNSRPARSRSTSTRPRAQGRGAVRSADRGRATLGFRADPARPARGGRACSWASWPWTGAARPVRGLAVMAAARRDGLGPVWLPRENVNEARALPGVALEPISSSTELRGDGEEIARARAGESGRSTLEHGSLRSPPSEPGPASGADAEPPDLAEVRGQAVARRALEIAAAGGHNVLLVGPPGAGKTMPRAGCPAFSRRWRRRNRGGHHHPLRRGRAPARRRPIRHPRFRAPHHDLRRGV